ncbi:MAG TPA: bifunctional diguanylate cyclase/phosphodiesterase [Euzebyales bacterium]|nr:bifunctional diguanylate cyclase/phosphodiesterase [Euzebyales bacterium]
MPVQGLRVFANAWGRAMTGSSYVPMSSAAVEEYLCGLAGGIADALLSDPFRPTAGYDVGAALVTTHFSSPEALGCTIEVFHERFLEDLEITRADARQRLAKLLGAMASGYARSQRGRTLDQQESIRRAALVGRDQAEQALRNSEARYRHLALHDWLTGLGNRRLVARRLASAFTGGAERVGVCLFDIDGFKVVNDTLGHDLGDRLLVTVAERLQQCVSTDGCVLARLSSDEFVILVEGSTGVQQVIEIARDALAAIAAPIDVDGHELVPSASVGIVERAVGDSDAADLMRAADITMRRAKRDGPGCWAVYDDEHNTRDLTLSQLAVALPSALDRHEFVIDYQPLVALGDGTILGYEALIRWQHPTLGTLRPDWFIPLAEQIGVIVPLGRRVIERACRDASQWSRESPASGSADGPVAPFVSVNLAARQIRHPGLLEDVTAILDATGLPPDQLQLEITESAMMGTDDVAVAALRRLARRGVRIAIDDFGTGYSNLAYLRALPVSELKLDGSFVQGLRSADKPDRTDEQIVAALVNLGHSLGLTVTAEGVETAIQADRLRLIGCDAGQGWHFGHPATLSKHLAEQVGPSQTRVDQTQMVT